MENKGISDFRDLSIASLERDLAAIARQYRHALEAHDPAAQRLETAASADRVRGLLWNFLESQAEMHPDDWVFLTGYTRCLIELEGAQMRVSGHFWCSFPRGRREWVEPFLAVIELSPSGKDLLTNAHHPSDSSR